MLELADEVDSKSIDGNIVRVQVPPPAPQTNLPCFTGEIFFGCYERNRNDEKVIYAIISNVELGESQTNVKAARLRDMITGVLIITDKTRQ